MTRATGSALWTAGGPARRRTDRPSVHSSSLPVVSMVVVGNLDGVVVSAAALLSALLERGMHEGLVERRADRFVDLHGVSRS